MIVERMKKWGKIIGYRLQAGHYNISAIMITNQFGWKEKNNFKKKKMCCVLGTISKKEVCPGFQEDISFSEVERERKRVFLLLDKCMAGQKAWLLHMPPYLILTIPAVDITAPILQM